MYHFYTVEWLIDTPYTLSALRCRLSPVSGLSLSCLQKRVQHNVRVVWVCEPERGAAQRVARASALRVVQSFCVCVGPRGSPRSGAGGV